MEDCVLINGGKRIEGETTVQGSKNAGLPLIAAAVNLGGVRVLKNIPRISDVFDFLKILSFYNVKSTFVDNELKIDSTELRNPREADFVKIISLSTKIRSSTYLLGAVLTKLKYLRLPKPGGCKLGTRPIDIHLSALVTLGGRVKEEHDYYIIELDNLVEKDIDFRYPSVGATINTLLVAINGKKSIIIKNTALEPEVNAVIEYLNKSGKSVERIKNNIRVSPCERNKNIDFKNPSDRIVMGDLLLSAIATKGELTIKGVNPIEIKALIRKITKSPCNLYINNDKIIYSPHCVLHGIIKTDPYPSFPTDLQAQYASAMLASGGSGQIVERVFGSRFEYAKQLELFGANLKISNRRLSIYKSCLHSATVQATDLRGGAALVIAGLSVNGYTRINNLHIIDRGYEDIVKMYNNLGADLKRIE